MFLWLLNLGFGEIFLVFIMYLIFFGSSNFPTLMRDFGRILHNIKRSASEIYSEINSNLDR